MHIIKYVGWLLLLPILISGCEEKTYDYGFREGGIGGSGWPVWVEYLIINESWQVPVGNLSGGKAEITKRPPGGAQSSLGWVPLPQTVRARWFSYRTQTFYEATVEIPKDKRKQIELWLKNYGTEQYLQDLSVGFAGQGEIQLWWYAGCVGIDCPPLRPATYESHFFELTPRIKATIAEGDPGMYRVRTLQEVREGSIPQDVLNLLPPEPGTTKESSTKNTEID
ncbi:DUF2931 family protein [Gynuella sp.]|uniref:DUF2931 family protein n=1 Tax=Gynuella sp. TaxID=2969146 RepID=UPI003D0CB91A